VAFHLDLNQVTQLLIVAVLLGIGRTFWHLTATLERLGGRFEEHTKGDEVQFQQISHRLDSLSGPGPT
jgi:hypothetical protein